MSGLRGDDDGGHQPPDPDGLPGFPAEWGRIVIPDDASELARDAARVRRELRREALLRRYGLRPHRRLNHLALPLILVMMAVLVATTSLFAAMWPGQSRHSARQPGVPTSTTPTTLRVGHRLPDLTLTDPSGGTVRLRATHPAVVLLTRHCHCGGLITGTARAAAPASVPVLVVGGRRQPSVPPLPGDARVRTLTDPTGALSAAVAAGASASPSDDTGAALLIDHNGTLVTLLPSTRDANGFAAQLPALTQ